MPKLTDIVALRPTQMTLGLREVERRRDQILALEGDRRRAYVADRKVPCVVGPAKGLYLIDRHHMCRALQEAGISRVVCDVVSDVSGLDEDEFWRFMDLRSWVHPFDRTGKRQPVGSLPKSIGALVDDPYRALAGFLRRDNGYTKAELPFEEFIWADFLRFRIATDLVKTDFATASARALELARSPMARHLPGWRGTA